MEEWELARIRVGLVKLATELERAVQDLRIKKEWLENLTATLVYPPYTYTSKK